VSPCAFSVRETNREETYTNREKMNINGSLAPRFENLRIGQKKKSFISEANPGPKLISCGNTTTNLPVRLIVFSSPHISTTHAPKIISGMLSGAMNLGPSLAYSVRR
jgi:hypothetical protein